MVSTRRARDHAKHVWRSETWERYKDRAVREFGQRVSLPRAPEMPAAARTTYARLDSVASASAAAAAAAQDVQHQANAQHA